MPDDATAASRLRMQAPRERFPRPKASQEASFITGEAYGVTGGAGIA
jgi:hypothetical protein